MMDVDTLPESQSSPVSISFEHIAWFDALKALRYFSYP